MFDHLTELPNRLLFFDRVSQAIVAAGRDGTGVGVLLLDLHRFKEVNDTLGHERGDELLRQVGPRLHGALRASDTVARLGGDEFGIALAGLNTPTEGEDVARKLTDALDTPFVLDGIDIALGGSIGIATYPDHGDDPDQLLRRAEVAMYVAKAAREPFESYRRRKTRIPPIGSRSSPTSARRSTTERSRGLPTDDRSRARHDRREWRPCCAGRTRRRDRSARTCSSRSPNTAV